MLTLYQICSMRKLGAVSWLRGSNKGKVMNTQFSFICRLVGYFLIPFTLYSITVCPTFLYSDFHLPRENHYNPQSPLHLENLDQLWPPPYSTPLTTSTSQHHNPKPPPDSTNPHITAQLLPWSTSNIHDYPTSHHFTRKFPPHEKPTPWLYHHAHH